MFGPREGETIRNMEEAWRLLKVLQHNMEVDGFLRVSTDLLN